MPPKSIVRVPRTQDSDSSNTTTYPILVLSLTQALNAANTSVTYTNPTGLGTLSSAGLYSAPITLTATSGDGTQSATANIILAPGAGTPLTETKVAHVISIIAASLCRREHLAPVVDPGFDITTNLGCPTCAALTGSYISYTVAPGTPALSYTWTLVPGPGTVTFASQNAASTPVSFSAAGTYTLQLSVFDGLATGSAMTHVIVNPPVTGNGYGYTFLITPPAAGLLPTGSPITLGLQLNGISSTAAPSLSPSPEPTPPPSISPLMATVTSGTPTTAATPATMSSAAPPPVGVVRRHSVRTSST